MIKKAINILPHVAVVASTLMLTGCFRYHKTPALNMHNPQVMKIDDVNVFTIFCATKQFHDTYEQFSVPKPRGTVVLEGPRHPHYDYSANNGSMIQYTRNDNVYWWKPHAIPIQQYIKESACGEKSETYPYLYFFDLDLSYEERHENNRKHYPSEYQSMVEQIKNNQALNIRTVKVPYFARDYYYSEDTVITLTDEQAKTLLKNMQRNHANFKKTLK